MTKFTPAEIEAEHLRRRGPERPLARPDRIIEHGDVCIHCGHPLELSLLPGQEAGLCDSCLSQDD
jgi:hypothetical protein